MAETDQTPVPYLYISLVTTPLGEMLACSTSHGISLLQFKNRRQYQQQLDKVLKRGPFNIINGNNKHLSQLKHQLVEYFSGQRKQFNLTVDLQGTPFQMAVWEQLITIPYGFTSYYQHQAERINKPGAVRAIAQAIGKNPIEIIIPCHRVIGKDGKLTGYSSGIDKKKWLLTFENQHQ